MFRTRTRKVFRDIWSRKVRTLLVSASIFIGVFGVVTLFSTGDILIGQLEKDIQQDRLSMLRVVLTVSAGANVDNEATLAELSAVPGVTVVEGRAVYPLLWRLPGEERFRDGTLAAYWRPFDQVTLEPPRLVEGEYPIERRMAERWGLGVGDTIEVRLLSARQGEQIVTATYTISGLLFQPYGEQTGPGLADVETLAFAAYDDAKVIAGFTGFSHIYARFIDYPTAEAESINFQAAIAQRTPYVPAFTVLEDPAANSLIESTRTTNRILVILAMVALVVSGFLVVNVINATVVEQRRQIGVMKSLGASRLDNFLIYAGIALGYGLIGVIPGVLLGIPGGYFAAQGLAAQSNTIIEEFAVSPRGIIIGIMVGLAVPLLAAVIPVYNGTRVTILEAMTDLGIESGYGRGFLARLIGRIPMPITLRQAVHNVNQKKFRLALTGTTLTVAVGAFMGIFAVFSSLGTVIEDVFSAFGSQLAIDPNEGQRFEVIRDLVQAETLQARLAEKGLPTVRAINPGASLAIEIEGYNPPPINAGPPGIFAFGLDTSNPELFSFTLKEGTDWTQDPQAEGVIISSRIADLLGKGVGDSIVIIAGGNRAEFPIIGVASYPFDTVWMEWQTLARLGGLVLDAPSPHSYAMGTTFVTVQGYAGSFDGQTGILGMTTTPDDQMSRLLSLVDGRLYTPGQNEIIISQELAQAGGYAVGDVLTLSIGERSGQYTVAGIFELPAQLDDNPEHPRDVIGMFWQDLAALEGRDFRGEVFPNSISIILAGDPTAAQVDAVIEEINDALLANGITANYTNWVEFQQTITRFILVFNIILYLAAALIAAVGAIGLLTSLSMSVYERQKEIGVMRSVGATSQTVAVQFLVEGITVGIVAWAFGIPLGYLISRGLIAALPFETFGIGFPPHTVLIGLAGMLAVVTVASLWPSLAAARKTVSDILRYQ
jgi:putative ABC transport system permease protein